MGSERTFYVGKKVMIYNGGTDMNLKEVYAILMEQASEASSMKERIWDRIMIALKIFGVIVETSEQ